MARSRLFGSLCGLVFLISFSRTVFAPLVSVFINEFAIQEGVAGLIVTLVWMGSAFPRLPAGWLLTRYPRRYVVSGAGLILAGMSGFMALTTSIPMVMVGAFGIGAASGIYVVAAGPLISELYPAQIGRFIGLHGASALFAATLAGPTVTGALVFGWRWLFAGIAITAVIVTLSITYAAKQTNRSETGADDTEFLAGVRASWRIVLFGILVLGIVGFVWQGVFNFYDLYLRSKGLSSTIARSMLMVLFGAGIPGVYVGGWVADRVSYLPLIIWALSVFIGGLTGLILASELWSLVLLTILIGFVVHMFFPAVGTFLLDSIPDHSRGSAYAFYLAFSMGLQSTGAAVVGVLIEHGISYNDTFSLLAGILVVVLTFLILFHWTNRLTDLADQSVFSQ